MTGEARSRCLVLLWLGCLGLVLGCGGGSSAKLPSDGAAGAGQDAAVPDRGGDLVETRPLDGALPADVALVDAPGVDRGGETAQNAPEAGRPDLAASDTNLPDMVSPADGSVDLVAPADAQAPPVDLGPEASVDVPAADAAPADISGDRAPSADTGAAEGPREAGAGTERLVVPLQVREFHGIARTDEPIATGIPLPRGLFRSTDGFGIQGAGASQFTPTVFWPDGSIRWVLAEFFASVPAHGTATYQLRTDGSAAGQPTALTVAEDAARVTVDTGPLSFTVRKTGGWNLFDEVSLGGRTIVSPSEESGARITAAYQDQLYKSAGEANGYEVAVLERGPVRACLRVRGHHGNATANDHAFYDFTAFICAYAGQSYVSVNYVVGNVPYWTPRGPLRFTDLDLRLRADLTGARTVTLFGAALQSGPLGARASIAQTGRDRYTSTLGDGTRALGWLDVSDGQRGVAVGVRQFWENFPKALSVESDGSIDVSLFPAEGGQPYWLQDEMRKANYVMFYFHEGGAAAANVQRVMGGMLNHRLLAVAPRRWYSDTRAVLGDLAEATTPIAHPHLPLVNDPVGDPAQSHEGWYEWGGNRYLNDDNARELYHDESVRFLQSFSPTDFLWWEASVLLEGLKPYHLHRDFRTMELFRTRSQPENNPHGFGHGDYWGSPSFGRLEDTPTDARHWGAGRVGDQAGWTSYPEGWIVQNIEHMDVKHVLDYYCFTGDPFAKEIVQSAGEQRGMFALIYLNSWAAAPPAEVVLTRVEAASACNLAAYHMVDPTPANLTQIRRLGEYFARSPGPRGFWNEAEISFQDGMNSQVAGILYDVSNEPAFRTALEANGRAWHELVSEAGFIPYTGTVPSGSTTPASATEESMYRDVGAVMTVVQYTVGHDELVERVERTEAAVGWGRTEPWVQKLYLRRDHVNEFRQNPFPSVLERLRAPESYANVAF